MSCIFNFENLHVQLYATLLTLVALSFRLTSTSRHLVGATTLTSEMREFVNRIQAYLINTPGYKVKD